MLRTFSRIMHKLATTVPHPSALTVLCFLVGSSAYCKSTPPGPLGYPLGGSHALSSRRLRPFVTPPLSERSEDTLCIIRDRETPRGRSEWRNASPMLRVEKGPGRWEAPQCAESVRHPEMRPPVNLGGFRETWNLERGTRWSSASAPYVPSVHDLR